MRTTGALALPLALSFILSMRLFLCLRLLLWLLRCKLLLLIEGYNLDRGTLLRSHYYRFDCLLNIT